MITKSGFSIAHDEILLQILCLAQEQSLKE
jgi:hypothetical protein